MKKLMVIALCSIFMVVGFASMSMAGLIGYLSGHENDYWSEDGSGFEIGRQATFSLDTGNIVTDYLAKFDWTDDAQDPSGFSIDVTTYKDGSESLAGTWTAPDSYMGYTVDYVTIKAGNGFNIFDTADNEWYTPFRKGLSHISFWGSQSTGGGNDPVPEPTTVLLLGFGLVGLATVGRRRMKKQ